MRAVLALLVAWGFSGAALAQSPYAGSFGGSSSLFIGTTPITGGATTQVLFNNGGVIGSDAGFTKIAGAAGTVTVGGILSVGQNVTITPGQFYFWTGQGGFASPADGTVQILNNSGSNRINLAVSGGNPGIGTFNGGIAAPNLTLSNLTTGTNADFLCLSAGGVVLLQTTACTISSLRFKPDWKPFNDSASAQLAELEAGTFHLDDLLAIQRDPNGASRQLGLNAENVAVKAPLCAIYEDDMQTPKSYRQECMIALLVKGFQEAQAEMKAIKQRLN